MLMEAKLTRAPWMSRAARRAGFIAAVDAIVAEKGCPVDRRSTGAATSRGSPTGRPMSNAFTSALKGLEPVPQIQATAKVAQLLERAVQLVDFPTCPRRSVASGFILLLKSIILFLEEFLIP
jgi:hypothetical protein